LDTSSGRVYYFHERTRETSWTPPPCWDERENPPPTTTTLYARDDDLDEAEPVDERVHAALEELNAAGEAVNEAELGLTQARRQLAQLESDHQAACQTQYEKLSRAARELLPSYIAREDAKLRQAAAQRAFAAASSAHASAKAAVSEVELRMLALAGDAAVDVALLAQCSDLASRVVMAESAKVRADHTHAQEARRVSALVAESQAGPRASKDAADKAQAYVALRVSGEAQLGKKAQTMRAREERTKEAKRRYAEALSSLERISLEVHERRAARGTAQ